MRGLAEQRDAMLRVMRRLLDRKRKQMTSGFNTDAAEYGMRLSFRGVRQLFVAKGFQPLGFHGCRHPNYTAAIARQRHKHARSLRVMELRRNGLMWPRMSDVEGQRGLIEGGRLAVEAGAPREERHPPARPRHKSDGQRFRLDGG